MRRAKDSDGAEYIRVRQFVVAKHEGQEYAPGHPYTEHLERVANYFQYEPELRNAALLHDVLEDTNATEQEIIDLCGEEVLTIVLPLTKKGRQSEASLNAYYSVIALDPRCLRVKLADLSDNLAHCIINLDERPNERDWQKMARRYSYYIHYLTTGEWKWLND